MGERGGGGAGRAPPANYIRGEREREREIGANCGEVSEFQVSLKIALVYGGGGRNFHLRAGILALYGRCKVRAVKQGFLLGVKK